MDGPSTGRSLVRASSPTSTDELGVRHELISAANLLRGQHGRRRTARQLVEQLGLSTPAAAALEGEFPRPDLLDDVFQFDRNEFQRHAPYRAIELDNGGLLVAEDAQFEQVFQRQVVNVQDRRVRFVTEGHVVDESLRKTK